MENNENFLRVMDDSISSEADYTITVATNTTDDWLYWKDHNKLNWNYPYPYPYEYHKYGPYQEELEKIIKDNYRRENMDEKRKVMKVYEVVVIDKRSADILGVQKVVAKNTETATLQLDLEGHAKERIKNGEIEFIFNQLGEFEKIEDKEEQ